MAQVPPHHVSRAYSEAQNKIQLVKNEAIGHGGAASVGLQPRAYVCLREAIDTAADPSGVAAHEVAHVVQQRHGRNNNNQPFDVRNNNNQQNVHHQMMSPDQQRTRADANLLLQGGFPAQMPVLNYREESGEDDRLGGLERYSSAYSAPDGTVYSEP